MITGPLYDDQNEMKLHAGAISHLSQHLDIPAADMTRIYELVLRRYKEHARIKDFLVVLAGRRVKYLLSKRTGRLSRAS